MTDLDRLTGRCRLLASTAALLAPGYLKRADHARSEAQIQRLADAKARYDAEVRDILREDRS